MSPNEVWVKVIKNIHEFDSGIDKPIPHSSITSPWHVVLNVIKHISKKHVSLCKHNNGNDSLILFWDDLQCGDLSFET